MNICLGGTFDPLHKGHKTLFEAAIDVLGDGKLYIGLTGDEFAKGSRGGQDISDYKDREKDIRDYLEGRGIDFTVVEIASKYGIAHQEKEFEAIAVSRETYQLAVEINRERKENGLEKLHIIVVDLVKNPHGDVIKGTRIRMGEMDAEGALLKGMDGGE